ncbi:hypothetical protein RhiirC2_101317 [Rhizophagus irregularis]|uniref:Uncharacterized protein n=1 Tax=Rhizophagus irregularis TaxID=588596 RepID=A0A2N1NTJ2_9GLOM|nr:hypothetical protein RhiirC2_101317 [Rhizophagus irregularis]
MVEAIFFTLRNKQRTSLSITSSTVIVYAIIASNLYTINLGPRIIIIEVTSAVLIKNLMEYT